MGRCYVRRGISAPPSYQPSKGDIVYIEGRKTAIKRVYEDNGVPFVDFTRYVDGTTGMSVRNLKAIAYLEDTVQQEPKAK